jgi:hypothetical protein
VCHPGAADTPDPHTPNAAFGVADTPPVAHPYTKTPLDSPVIDSQESLPPRARGRTTCRKRAIGALSA